MGIAPRDRIVRMLAEGASESTHSAEMRVDPATLGLHVDGVGEVRLPVRAPMAKKLLAASAPAHVGKGEDTLLDTAVRDTGVIGPERVRFGEGWGDVLAEAVERLGARLALPRRAKITAELHSMLVYGTGQFFAPHQDSEKHDDMIATLVVMLPTSHSGGELVVDDGGVLTSYAGDEIRPVLVAFYADRRHEVLPVRRGYRVSLTYNLLISNDVEVGRDVTAADEAGSLLQAYFATSAPRWEWQKDAEVPNRLAILLDHEYSRRGLADRRLKGADADRVALMIMAAEAAGCSWALAQIEMHETRDACDGVTEGEIIDDEATVCWWTDDEAPGDIDLWLTSAHIAAVTPNAALSPYDSQYEGYMGNYGNTIDRWYRRAALVIWPRSEAFAVRADADADWAFQAARAALAAGDTDAVRAMAPVLSIASRPPVRERLADALALAAGVDSRALAAGLLASYPMTMLTEADAGALCSVVDRYGVKWWTALEMGGRAREWHHGGRLPEWVTTVLEPLCRAIRGRGAGELADAIANRAWQQTLSEARQALGFPARRRDELLVARGADAAAEITAASPALRTQICGDLVDLGREAFPLWMSALRVLDERVVAPPVLVGAARDLLRGVVEAPERSDDDWSIEWKAPAGLRGPTADAAHLAEFLSSRSQTQLRWPLRQDRREVIHRLIDDADLPVAHTTERLGRPFTLVLQKQPELFANERIVREHARRDLVWLDAAGADEG